MSSEMITNLGKRFHARYAKSFTDLNSKMIKALDEFGGFDVPSVQLGSGGFSETLGGAPHPEITPAQSETGVARVGTKLVKYKPLNVRYVIRIPWSDAEMAHNNPEYFDQYFDNVMKSAVSEYTNKYGSHEIIRYGEEFMNYVNFKGEVFRYDGSGEHLDLYITGRWASGERV